MASIEDLERSFTDACSFRIRKEYRTCGMKPETSSSPDPCHGNVVLENCGFDWKYSSGEKVSLEILGEQGWRLLHVLPSSDGYYVGIFERDIAE